MGNALFGTCCTEDEDRSPFALQQERNSVVEIEEVAVVQDQTNDDVTENQNDTTVIKELPSVETDRVDAKLDNADAAAGAIEIMQETPSTSESDLKLEMQTEDSVVDTEPSPTSSTTSSATSKSSKGRISASFRKIKAPRMSLSPFKKSKKKAVKKEPQVVTCREETSGDNAVAQN